MIDRVLANVVISINNRRYESGCGATVRSGC